MRRPEFPQLAKSCRRADNSWCSLWLPQGCRRWHARVLQWMAFKPRSGRHARLSVSKSLHTAFWTRASITAWICSKTRRASMRLLISTHAYYGAMGRPKEVMADHGVPIRDNKNRKLRRLWVNHHDKYFNETTLRHSPPDPALEYANRDVLTELVEPARQRGMKLYVRWYQVGASTKAEIQNLEKVLTVDMNGKPGHKPCWFNPEYRAWLVATMTDLFENYPLDGLQYGPERQDPITEMYVWGAVPNCFCPHCLQRARTKGIDANRARQGFAKLFEFMKGLRRGQVNPADGVFISLLRILLKNPEILLWNYQYFEGSEEVHRLVYQTVKAIRPEIQVGRHLDHIQSSGSVTYRASLSYAEMAQYADFIKPILYHDIFGPRLKKWHVDALGRTFLKEFSPEQSLELYYALFGLDPTTEPKLEELDQRGFLAGVRPPRNQAVRGWRRRQDSCVSGHRLGRTQGRQLGHATLAQRSGNDLPSHSPSLRRGCLRRRGISRVRGNRNSKFEGCRSSDSRAVRRIIQRQFKN